MSGYDFDSKFSFDDDDDEDELVESAPARRVVSELPALDMGVDQGLLDVMLDDDEDDFSLSDLEEVVEHRSSVSDLASSGEANYKFHFTGASSDDEFGIKLDRNGMPYIGEDPTDPDFEYERSFEHDGFYDLDRVLEIAIKAGASDVHVHADRTLRFTVNKDLIPVYFRNIPPATPQALEVFTEQDISSLENEEFSEYRELDASYEIQNTESEYYGRRFRLSMGRSMTEVFLVLRTVNDEIPSVDKLGITGELLSWTELPNGLIMVNGPTGTGKSTTLASMLRRIQLSYAKKIITLEKPIEYVYDDFPGSLVTQRQIGMDSISFSNALDGAMRQHPNIIMVGEVRNNTEVEALLRSAESGHLTISTMHTNNAPATLNRIKSLFSGDEQSRVLSTLADVSRGFANQELLKKKSGGMFAVREVLTVNSQVKDMIWRGAVNEIEQYQIENKITMEHELHKVYKEGLCTLEEAYSHSSRPLLWQDILDGKV